MNRKNKFKIMLIVPLIMLAGCSATYKTIITPIDKKQDTVLIEVDQDATALGIINTGDVKRVNYKYSFAVAAQTTMDNGYAYFTIINPHQLVQHFKDRKVKTVENAYDVCDSGPSSFRTGFSYAGLVTDANNCDYILHEWMQYGSVRHSNIKFTIKMHNNKNSNLISFNAIEVLQSDLVAGLNKKYFKNMTR